MSFSAGIKEELAGYAGGNACCLLSELAGITLAAGSMRFSGGYVEAEITTESAAIARRVYAIIKQLYSSQPRIEQHERRRLNRNISYRVVLADGDAARKMLTDIGVLGGGDVSIGIKPGLVRLSCCQGAFLRGMYLGCGTMSDPEKSYQLELVLQDEQLARSVASLLAGAEIEARVAGRHSRQVVYIKEADHISEFLALSGAHTAMLRFESVRVKKGVRNTANRLTNCDTANVDRTVKAAGRQLENIAVLERHGRLRDLPMGLREAAEARAENPEATLDALCALLGNVSKSGLNNRFRRLEEIATEISNREEPDNEPKETDHQQ
jgi:cell division protein WhiA